MNLHKHGDLTIATENVSPPLPARDHDWCAYLDGLGADASPYGWGKTEQEAIDNLLLRLEEEG